MFALQLHGNALAPRERQTQTDGQRETERRRQTEIDGERHTDRPVSYTHLTLPTRLIV